VGKYVPTTITYQKSGLVKDRDDFVLSDDAYSELENIFQWRGRLRRRPGYELLGRLRRDLSSYALANVSGNPYNVADVLTAFRTDEPNAALVSGSVNLTFDTGNPGETTFTDDGEGGWTRTAGTTYDIDTSSSYINYVTGEVNLLFTAGSIPAVGVTVLANLGYYPCLPVMGLPTRELDLINAEQTIAFDTKYCYVYNNTFNRFRELTSTTATTWQGSDSDFFWGVNYWQTTDNEQYFWVTNFTSGATADPIRVYDGQDWYTFAPTTGGANQMHQCRMLIPYKGRMVALNTWEGTTLAGSLQYPQRARWSQNGAPFSAVAAGVAPTATEEWRSDVKGRGGFVDCPVNEHIVSAEFIRDVLVVGFESSTWLLRYTGNELLPFVWERINRELGSESTFSMIAFDRGILSIGDKSINSCDGNGVERIDENIPDEVFKIHNSYDPSTQVNDGPLRVHGKRDFYERIVYWTFPNASTEAKFPDSVLVFNYHNYTWATFQDSFTAFGEYQRFNDITWADLAGIRWSEANFSWVTAKLQSQFPNIIAGNQQGFVLNLNQAVSNSASLFVKDVTGGGGAVRIESPDHNLQSGEFVKIENIVGTGEDELNDRIFKVERIDDDNIDLYEKPRFAITEITKASQAVVTAPGHNFEVGQHFYIDKITAGMTQISNKNGVVVAVSGNTVTVDIDSSDYTTYTAGGYIQNLDASVIETVVATSTYLGKGTMKRVLGFKARSKKFNLLEAGSKNFLGQIDFLTDSTSAGEISCKIFTDYNDSTAINEENDGFVNNVFSTVSEDIGQANKSKEWHRFYCQTNAQFFDFELTLNEREMFTPAIVDSDVLVDSIIIWSRNGGRLVE